VRLFEFERRWLLEVFDTLLPSGVGRTLPIGARDVPLAGYVDELVRFAPLDVVVGVRLCLWFLLLCPLFVIGRWSTFFGLEQDERIEVLDTLKKSPSYVVREIPLLFKMLGCLGFCGVPEVQAHIGVTPRDSSPPDWAGGQERS
jgi:hypothetical protein